MSRKTRKNKHTGSGNKALAILIGTTCGIAAAPNSFAGPTGGEVTGGQGTISTPNATTTVIDQASSRLSLNWSTFDVAANETVRFVQPNSTAVAVNRILDQKPSEVYGRIDANGRVVLINPNGMLFGRTAQINVGSLLATSLDVVSFDSTTGRLNLAAAGTPGAIVNDGSIRAAQGGSVTLLGGLVANNGLIVAERGAVNLAAGRSATLDFYGGGLLRFETGSELTQNASGSAAAVSNTGDVYADGGQVLLTTSAARNVFDRAVNNDGVIRANRIDNSGGSIRLVGAGGTVVSSGVLDASGTGTGTGGEVQVLGENVGLFGNALVDVSGNNGGGTALIGGDYQGANADVLNARYNIVAPGAVVRADARESGDGGKVIFWSDEATQFYGTVTGRGAASGNGGFMEASSHGVLDFSGNVDLGAGGQLLLDPDNITINAGGTDGPSLTFGALPGTNASVSAGSIQTFLNTSGSLTMQALNNITVTTSINASAAPAGNSLTMQAGGNITINDNVTVRNNGSISLTADDATAPGNTPGGSVTFNTATSAVRSDNGDVTIQGASVQLGNVTANNGDVDITAATTAITQVAGTTILADNIDLTATTAIGQITNVRQGTGNAVSVDTNGSLTAVVSSNAGTINLNFVNGLPTLAANAITLGSGAASGTVLLQTAGDFDASGLDGVVSLGNGNTATGALRAVDVLTVNSTDTASVFDFAPQTLALRGDDITDGGADLTFNVANLIFDSGGDNGDETINGNIGRLSATVGNLNGLAVSVDNAIVVTDVISGDDISITAGAVGTGNITVGALQATNDVTLNATNGGAIIDDLDNTTRIQGGQLSLTGNSIGSQLANGDIDTTVTNFTINASAGDVVITETDAAGISAFAAAGGALTRIETVNGAMSLNTNLNPTTGNVVLIAGGNNNLDVSDRVVGAQSGTGNTTIRSGNNLRVGEVVGNNITLESGYNRTSTGGIIIDTGNASTEIVRAGSDVTLLSDGTIAQAGEGGDVVPSVTGSLLTITAGGTVNLDTNVSSLNATVSGAGNDLTIREAAGPLTVVNAQATDVVDVRTLAGAMNNVVASGATVNLNSASTLLLSNVNSGGGSGAVNLTAVGTITDSGGTSVSGGTLTINGTPTTVALNTNVATLVGNTIAGDLAITDLNALTVNSTTVTGGDIDITANGNLTLGAVSAGTGTAALRATGGALTNAGNTLTAGGGLTITNTGSVNLATDVGAVTATNIGTTFTLNETTGSLIVQNVSAGGLVNVSTTNGALANVTASGVGVTLTAGGAGSGITLTDVDSNTGTTTLSAGSAGTPGTISGPAITVTGAGLNITRASTVNLDVDVATLAASNVTGNLTINDQSGNLLVQGVAAGGAVTIGTTGVIQDDDSGTTASNTISGSSVTLTAGQGIGTVSDAELTTGAGQSVDVNTTGILTATVNSSTNAQINLNLVTTPAAGTTITLGSGTGRDGNVLLQSAGNLNLQDLAAGSISIGDLNSVGVGYVSGGTLRLRDTGSVTDFAPTDLLVRGADIYQGAGTTRTFSFDAGTLSFIATAPAAGADYILNTDVGTLNATVGNGVGLTVNELNGVTLGTVAATSFTLNANGAIADDNLEGTAITGTDVTLTSATNAIGSTAGNGAIDVIMGSGGTLTASSFTGDVAIRATGGNAFTADLTAGSGVAGDGNISLVAASNVTLTGLNAGGDNASVTTSGSITGAGISASQLTLANASSVDIDTNVDNLTATNIAGNVRVDEASGPLTAGTVTSNNGNVELNVAGGALTLGTVTASNGTVTLSAAGAIADGPATSPSVVANQLTVTSAGSVDLDTNVATLNASGVGTTLTIRELNALAVTNAAATGAVNISTTGGSMTNVTASGSSVTLAAGGAASGIALTNVNAGAGNVALTAGNAGAITDGAGTSVTGAGLTITGAGSVDLNTNVATLAATGITGALAINDTNALQVTNAASNGITLTAGGTGNALTLGTVNAGTGAAVLSATGGAITNGASTLTATGGLTINAAGSVDLRTDVNNVTVAAAVGGPFSIAEQTGALTIGNVNATGAANVSTVAGALTVSDVTGAGVTLVAGGAGNALTLNGTVNAGAGTATLTAGGAVTDATTDMADPSVIAGNTIVTGASIGSASNTLNINVDNLTATASTGDMFFHEQNSVTLTNLTGANGRDVFVGAQQDITVNQISVTGSGAAGRVLLAAGRDVFATPGLTGTDAHITAQNIEVRAGGMDTTGGQIGTDGVKLRLAVPDTIPGGATNTGDPVSSVLFLQRPVGPDSEVPLFAPQFDLVSNPLGQISSSVLPNPALSAGVFLTTVFTTRTAQTDGTIALVNSVLPLTSNASLSYDPDAQNNFLDLSSASNAQGEGTLYIDWASFDPNVSLFGTVNPPICLPRDQQEEDDSEAPAAANAASSGCASTTAQEFDGTFHAPTLELVITSHGLEWKPVRASLLKSLPLIAQR